MSSQVMVILASLLLPKILAMRVILAKRAANEKTKPMLYISEGKK